MNNQYIVDRKEALRKIDRLTRPPRLENRVKNVRKSKKVGKK